MSMSKGALILGALLAQTTMSFAQGTIILMNADLPNPSGGGTYNAVMQVAPDLGGGFPGNQFSVALFREGSVTPIAGSITTFFNGTGADAQYNWIIDPPVEVVIPGTAPGTSPRLFVGLWYTAQGTFPQATWRGQSATFEPMPLGGPNPAGGPPFLTPPTTFQGFAYIPEPTSMALGALGLGALLLRRRK